MTLSVLIILVFFIEKILFKLLILIVIGVIYYAYKTSEANDFVEKLNESEYVKIKNFPFKILVKKNILKKFEFRFQKASFLIL